MAICTGWPGTSSKAHVPPGRGQGTQPLGDLELVGTIDRIDAVSSSTGEPTVLVIDYKTESDSVTRQRIQSGAEDTQLPFYAALLQPRHAARRLRQCGRARRDAMHEQDEVVHLRDVLVEGIQHDMARIAAGAPLPALGEGSVCDFCAARGLCRKDFGLPNARARDAMTKPAAYEHNGQPVSREAFYAIACDPAAAWRWRPARARARPGCWSRACCGRCSTAAAPHEILAITFTKKAAGEMRQRLQEWLEPLPQRRWMS
jgi:hypothetical protein